MERALEAQDRLSGLGVAIAGRNELYVASLAALLESLGASVRALELPQARRGERAAQVVILEDPRAADLEALASPGPPVIVLADDGPGANAPANAGPELFRVLPKNVAFGTLVRAIRDAVEWGARRPGPLTARQVQVLALIAEGLDNEEIALRLGITARTARAHTSAILERLGVANRTQAAVAAVRHGLIGGGPRAASGPV